MFDLPLYSTRVHLGGWYRTCKNDLGRLMPDRHDQQPVATLHSSAQAARERGPL